MAVIDSTVDYDQSGQYGGGIANDGGILTVTDSTVSDNYSDVGGGIADLGGPTGTTMTISDSTLADNIAVADGGGHPCGWH